MDGFCGFMIGAAVTCLVFLLLLFPTLADLRSDLATEFCFRQGFDSGVYDIDDTPVQIVCLSETERLIAESIKGEWVVVERQCLQGCGGCR